MIAFYMALVATAMMSASAYWVLRTLAVESERDAHATRQEIAWIGPAADAGAPPQAGEPQAGAEREPARRIAETPPAELEFSC